MLFRRIVLLSAGEVNGSGGVDISSMYTSNRYLYCVSGYKHEKRNYYKWVLTILQM